MLKPESMSKIFLVGPKTKLPAVVAKLHELKVLHVVDHIKGELDIGEPLAIAEKLSALLVEVRTYKSHLEAKAKKFRKEPLNSGQIEARLSEISKEYREITEKQKAIEQELPGIGEDLRLLGILNSLHLDPDSLSGFRTITSFVGFFKPDQKFRQRLDAITKKYTIHTAPFEAREAVSLFVEKEKTEEVFRLLKGYGFSELNLQKLSGFKGDVKDSIKKLNGRIEKLAEANENLSRKLEKLKSASANFLLNAEEFLATESEKAMAPLRFAQTKQAFVIKGWVPKKKLHMTVEEIEASTGSKVYIAEQEIGHNDKVPIILKNPVLAKPFEFFIDLYTLPDYREIDPTFFVFLWFPIFFGYMLGDVGYGIVCLLLFYYVKKKMPSGKALINAMMICSVSTIFFGFLFGEYMGYEGTTAAIGNALHSIGIPMQKVVAEGSVSYLFPHIISRVHGEMMVAGYTLPSVIVIAAILGIIHLNFGFVLGFFNVLKHHGLKDAILEKFSWIMLEISVALLVLGSKVHLPSKYIAPGLAVLSLLMIVAGEGVKGAVELPGLVGNIFSYFRLGAIGIASVGLAVIVNEQLAGPMFASGNIILILVAMVIMVLGHAINIGIGILGGALQTLRLHYVEFFSKFYTGGGKKYSPFGLKEGEEA